MWLSPREQGGLAQAQNTAPDRKRQSGEPLGAEQEGQTEHTGQSGLADSSGEKWLSAHI